jgi:exopolysaccharide biosynthesis polyprenyl glycosylphosphotransferase
VLRVFQHWFSRRKLALFSFELMAVVALAAAASALASGVWGLARATLLSSACGLIFQGTLYFADLYNPQIAAEDRAAGVRLLRTLSGAVLCFAALAVGVSRFASGPALVAGVAGATAAVILTRAGLPAILGPPEPVLLLGRGPRARELAEAIARDGEGAFEVVGTFSGPGVEAAARRLGVRVVVVAPEAVAEAFPIEELLRLRLRGIRVLSATDFAERALRRLPVSHLRAEELVFAEGFRFGRLDAIAKRAFDVAAAAALVVICAPVMVVAALLVRLDSDGPILYRQERVGRNGRSFLLTKFRTMRPDAEADGRPVWARLGDARVTRVGRFLRKARLDELPQLFAVLRGDMSLVGPRPERPFFVEQIKREVPFYSLREEVKPGITGWAQLRYPYGASLEDARAKLEYDLYYLKNRTLFLDAAVVFHTVRHVLVQRGAR